jgi:hypothetical protein
MNLIAIKDKFKPFLNEGFNYKDRKISHAGKIWIKDTKEKNYDIFLEEKKHQLKH